MGTDEQGGEEDEHREGGRDGLAGLISVICTVNDESWILGQPSRAEPSRGDGYSKSEIF